MENGYDVYIRVDDVGSVTEISSSAFITDTSGWIKIDSGKGDRYCHAQNHYLDQPLHDDQMRLQWRWAGDKLEMIKESDRAEPSDAVPQPDPEEEAMIEIAELAADNAARLDEQDAALCELASMIGGE